MIIESHAHYSHKRYDGTFRYLTGQLTAEEGNRDGLLKRLRESGVALCIEPAIDFDSNRLTAALYRQHPDFFRLAVGVRPRHHRLVQLLWFRYQLDLARRTGLPLVLHIRMADRDALPMLRRRRRWLPGGVVHCFQGGWETARQYLDLGLCLGIGGALLRRESAPLRETVARAPLERLLVETDSPYVLPDIPWEGSRKSLGCRRRRWRQLCWKIPGGCSACRT